MNNPKHLLITPFKAQNTVLKVIGVALFLFSTGITIRSQTEEPISEPPNYWAIESAAERAKLPLYKTIPAAKPSELTPSNELPPRSDYRDWYRSHGAHEATTAHFADFKGVLQSDAYQPYITFEKGNEFVELAACWAHARRKFFDAKDLNPRECGVYLALVGKLYAVETEIREKNLSPEVALELRQRRSANTHARIYRVLRILRRRSLPKSPLGKACDYSLRIWSYLSTYLTHGRVAIDNNAMENAIRPTAIGKKNWLFVGHPEAGKRAAIIYSVLISCTRLEIDPASYLRSVLSQDTRVLSKDKLAALTPAQWKKSNQS